MSKHGDNDFIKEITVGNSKLKRWILTLSVALALGAGARPALANDWPSKPVRIVTPYSPGGNNDILARLTADRLSKAFGRSFIVESRPGASGIIAADYVAHQLADGYTLFFGTITQISIAPFIYKIRYDPVKDFVPIANIGENPYVITVGTKQRFKSLADLVNYAKMNPGKLTVGHAGVGSMTHLSAGMFLRRASITATMVPYKGGVPALTDMIAGQTDMYSANVSDIMPHLNGGRVKLLGVSSERRIKQLPNVPAIAEIYPGYVVGTWNGFLGPAGMPAEDVDKLASEITKILSSVEFQAKLDDLGVTPLIGEVKDVFAQRIQKDMIYWKPVIEQMGIKPE